MTDDGRDCIKAYVNGRVGVEEAVLTPADIFVSVCHNHVMNHMRTTIGAMVLSVALSACKPVQTAPTPPTPPTSSATPTTAVQHKGDPAADMSGKVQSLQRQLQERDKRIEELEAQLDALKLIDQEHEKQRKPPRAPTSVEPVQ